MNDEGTWDEIAVECDMSSLNDDDDTCDDFPGSNSFFEGKGVDFEIKTFTKNQIILEFENYSDGSSGLLEYTKSK